MKKIIIFAILILFSFSSQAFALTTTYRDQMISIAGPYTKVPWKVSTINTKYSQFKTSGTNITGMAYSYGDKVKIGTKSLKGTFLYEINQGLKPRNWKGSGISYSKTTGIDCSGYVSWIWGLPSARGTSTLGDSAIADPVPEKDDPKNPHVKWDMKKGDIFNWSGNHVVLYVSGPDTSSRYKIYEASGSAPKQVVWYNPNWTGKDKKGNFNYKPYKRKNISETTEDTKAPVQTRITPPYPRENLVYWGSSYTHRFQVDDAESDYDKNTRGDVSDNLSTAYGPNVTWQVLKGGKEYIKKKKKFSRTDYWGVHFTKKVKNKQGKDVIKDYRESRYVWNFGSSEYDTGQYIFKVTASDWNGNKSKSQQIRATKRAKYSRLWGKNSYLTNKAIATKNWTNGSKYLILVRTDEWYDAVAGARLSKRLNAPILINPSGEKTSLNSTTNSTISWLNAKNKIKKIYIIGGPKAISRKVERTLTSSYGKNVVKRLYGSNGPKTAIATAKTVGNPKTAVLISVSTVDFPAALSAASAAAYKGYSVLYTFKNDLPDATKDYINDYVNKVYIIGGTGSISEDVKNAVDSISGVTVERIGGGSKWVISQNIIDKFWPFDKNWAFKKKEFPKKVVLTNGSNSPYVNGYGGIGYAAKNSSPLLIVQKQGELPWFKKRIDTEANPASSIILLGSTAETNYYFRKCSDEKNYPTLNLVEDANVYSEPSEESEIINVAYEGQSYVPIDPEGEHFNEEYDPDENSWHKIYFAGKEGYIHGQNVQGSIGDKVIEISNDTDVYEYPEYEEEFFIGSIPRGHLYVSPIEEDGWAGIYFDGSIGYIPPDSYKVAQIGPKDRISPAISFDVPKYINRGEKIFTISVDESLDEEDGLIVEIKDSDGSPINFEMIKEDVSTDSIEEQPPDEEIIEDEEGDAEIDENDQEETITESYDTTVSFNEGPPIIGDELIPDEGEETEEGGPIIEDETEEEMIEDVPTDAFEIDVLDDEEESEEEPEVEQIEEKKEESQYVIRINIEETVTEGLGTIYVKAKDTSGNTSEVAKTFVIDLSAPETKVIPKIEPYLSEDGKLYTNKDNTFLINPEDKYSGVENLFVSINNQDYQSFSSAVNIIIKVEGAYKIKYYATDKVGNKEEEKTYQIIIDNTPPESIISADLINENFEVIPETQFTIHSTDKGKYPSGLSAIQYRIDEEAFKEYTPFMLKGKENGIHTITYRAIDNATNTEEQKTFVVNLKDALSVSIEDKTNERRTAVWLNVNEEEKPLINREKLESLLKNNNYIYKITDSREQFIQDLKSNLYTSYIILGNQLKLTDHQAAKLREQIFIGKTIISSLFTNIDEAPKPKTSSEFDEIFGVKHVGSLPSSNHEINLDENLNINGKAIKYEANNYTEKIGSIDDTNYPAIIKNTFGKGKTYLFAFDLINNLNNQEIIEIMNTSLEETNPTVGTLPLSPKVFKLNIKANVVLLTSQIDIVGSNAISYIPENYPYLINTTLDEQQSKLILRYLDENNSIFNINTGYYVRGELIPYKSFTFEETIEKTRYQLIDEIINEFDSYLVMNEDSKIKLARDFLITLKESSTTLTNDQIVHELLKTIKDVIARDDLSNKTRENLSKLVVVYSSY